MRFVLCGVIVAVAGCAGVPLPRESLTDPGALLYNGYVRPEVDCYRCHDGTGKGTRGPSLLVKVPGKSAERLAKTITKGSGFMPKYGDKLSEEEVSQLIAWLQATFK